MPELTPNDIESIERATLAAVPPQQLLTLPAWPQWLVPLDSGTMGRAKSAVPLSHTSADVDVIDAVEAAYRDASVTPAWRLPLVDNFASLRAALIARRYRPEQLTCVKVGNVSDALKNESTQHAWQVQVFDQPHPHWQQVFFAPGFDAKDAASRVSILSRSQTTHYGVIVHDGEPVACGALSISHGWASLHGMRTAAAMRNQGLASALIRTFAQRAHDAGATRWFLQVEAENASANHLYAQFGFQEAWRYEYWRR
jgi:N-acetylglutamate synthase